MDFHTNLVDADWILHAASHSGEKKTIKAIEKQSGRVVSGPDIISRGFVYVRESEALMDGARAIVKKVLAKCEGK